jgi:D-alanyl-D-alanine dipeptidase
VTVPRTVSVDALAGHADFRDLRAIPGVQVDLRYASGDNFLGRDLYSPHDCAFLHREAAEALALAAAALAQQHASHALRVLDAVRPQRVQEAMWAAVSAHDRLYLADPGPGSIHSFGMAVDVTIVDAGGQELDMGTGFDEMDERSHPVLEARFLAEGALTPRQVANREMLRAAMLAGGFRGISTEWWHFDCGERTRVRSRFARVV